MQQILLKFGEIMRIVICVSIDLSLLLIKPLERFSIGLLGQARFVQILAITVLLGGCWNTFWYGLNGLGNNPEDSFG